MRSGWLTGYAIPSLTQPLDDRVPDRSLTRSGDVAHILEEDNRRFAHLQDLKNLVEQLTADLGHTALMSTLAERLAWEPARQDGVLRDQRACLRSHLDDVTFGLEAPVLLVDLGCPRIDLCGQHPLAAQC